MKQFAKFRLHFFRAFFLSVLLPITPFLSAQNDCPDNCLYQAAVDVDGLSMKASLNPPLQDTPFFFYVLWTLDDGIATGSGLEFNALLKEPGIHKICAEYPTGDFTAETCTVCTVFNASTPCQDSSLIDFSIPCPLAFIPVCGCDGITYDNACTAYNYFGITSWRPGICGSVCNNMANDFDGFNSGGSLTLWTFNDRSVFPGGQISSWYWDFGNGSSSFEQNPTVQFFDPGDYQVCLTVSGLFSDGTQCGGSICRVVHVANQLCIDPLVIDTLQICPTVFQPVCGCDGKTYTNDCIAQHHFGVTEWTPGYCPGACINLNWVDTTATCLEIFDPVCGCDSITYANECVARRSGLVSWKKGACCPQESCHAFFESTALPGNRVQLIDLSTLAEHWGIDFGNGVQQSGFFDTLVYTYAQSGQYEICLEISDADGVCTDRYCQTVEVGLSETDETGDFFACRMYPNPAADLLRVRTLGAALESATLTDIFGKTVWTSALQGSEAEISVKSAPSGIYFLYVKTEKGASVRKITIQH